MKVNRIRGAILTARPQGMRFEVYKELRKQQETQLKNRLRYGFQVWPSRSMGQLVGKVPAIKFV